MARISGLSDELLVKILSFLPTKEAVSTSVLSKQWEFLWMWLPKLEYDDYDHVTDRSESALQTYRDFIAKNLPLHRAPIIESLSLGFRLGSLQPEDLKSWVGIAVSRRGRELSICYLYYWDESPQLLLPCSLYTCKSLVTLKLEGEKILVDVPSTVCLPSLKTLQLERVTYSNEDSLRLLLSYCPVLEDLSIVRDENDNLRAVVVIVSSLQRLSLEIPGLCSSDAYVIVTPYLKYFKVVDYRESMSYLIEQLPELEEADIVVLQYPENLLESVTFFKRLSLRVLFNSPREVICFHMSTSCFLLHYLTQNQIFLILNPLLLCCHVCRLCFVMVLSSIGLKI
ncbi:F-box-like domain superfamily [Arabidopsis suecica]|uniref:F-box-like domain superfamily n=1 Tax=Arabidopsis suecica TaxID=45249 RepID=A0A8T1Y1V8_ARASU|nr:F-box-like domain superfamily [Arabidopsis suecica]